MIAAAALLALLTLSGVHAQGSGETLISNVGQDDDGADAGLDGDVPKRAQWFSPGSKTEFYLLTSVGIRFRGVDDTTPETRLAVVITRAADRIVTDPFVTPGDEVCTLTHPSVYSDNAVNYFDAPPGGCVLDGDGRYFVVVHRTDTGGEDIGLAVTDSDTWDEGGAPGWSISPHRQHSDGETWERTRGEAHMIDLRGGPCPALWCATLTVGSDSNDGSLGWAESGGPYGNLSDDNFVHGGDEYELDEIRLSVDGSLTLTFEKHGVGRIKLQAVRDSLELQVDGQVFNLGDGELQTDKRTIRWQSSAPEWSEGQGVSLRIVEVATKPQAPRNLTAVAAGRDGEVKLSWETPPPVPGAGTIIKHQYRQRTTGTYDAWQTIHQSGANQSHESSYTVSGLTNDTAYTFQVRSANSTGYSRESKEASATPRIGGL